MFHRHTLASQPASGGFRDDDLYPRLWIIKKIAKGSKLLMVNVTFYRVAVASVTNEPVII